MKQKLTIRLIVLVIILILGIICCYEVLFGNAKSIRSGVKSIAELKALSNDLEKDALTLEKYSTTDFEQKKASLEKTIEEYQKAKTEYEDLIPTSAENVLSGELNEMKDVYEVDFLWTIVGNYATEEGINLKFDVNRNTTSASSISNTSSNYIVCDLRFTIEGSYVNLTNFIYDIEDDDRLNFEINNFEMTKGSSDLKVALIVKAIKLNADSLIQSNLLNTSSSFNTSSNSNDAATQTVSSDTSTDATNVSTNTVDDSTNKSIVTN